MIIGEKEMIHYLIFLYEKGKIKNYSLNTLNIKSMKPPVAVTGGFILLRLTICSLFTRGIVDI